MTKSRKWIFFFLGWVGMVLYFTQRWLLGPLIPELMTVFNANQTSLGAIGSASMWGYMFTPLLAGWLSDRFGRKHIILAGIFGFSSLTLLCGLAVSAGQLFWARFFTGLVYSRAKGLALGLITTMGYACGSFAPVLIGSVADRASVSVGLGVVCAPAAFLTAILLLATFAAKSSLKNS